MTERQEVLEYALRAALAEEVCGKGVPGIDGIRERCRNFALSSVGICLIGGVFASYISSLKKVYRIKAVGGASGRGDAVALAAAAVGGAQGEYNAFIVRENPKDHGTTKLVEGSVEKGSRVVVFDDVVSSGDAVGEVIDNASASGLVVMKVMCLLDCGESARERIGIGSKSSPIGGFPFYPVMTMQELNTEHERSERAEREKRRLQNG